MMTWEEKFAAIRAIRRDAHLRMREPGNWYVSTGIEIGGDEMLRAVGESGATPEEAVEKTWQLIERLPLNRCIVVGAYTDQRRELRWNGYMWADVPK